MNNKLFCSTGTMIGRINNYDFNGFISVAPQVHSDGFELMMLSKYFGMEDYIFSKIKENNLKFPTFHALKEIGEYLGQPETQEKGIEIFTHNCSFAQKIGAKLIVLHLWSGKISDANIDCNISVCGKLNDIAKDRGVTLAIENVPCSVYNPVKHIKRIMELYPDLHFIMDTRFAALHDQFKEFVESDFLYNGKFVHMHVSEFSGSPLEFSALRPILHPGDGKTDFNAFFSAVLPRYNGSITLESPVMTELGLDIEKLNRSLDFIRENINKY